jgi:hypothetical protein
LLGVSLGLASPYFASSLASLAHIRYTVAMPDDFVLQTIVDPMLHQIETSPDAPVCRTTRNVSRGGRFMLLLLPFSFRAISGREHPSNR